MATGPILAAALALDVVGRRLAAARAHALVVLGGEAEHLLLGRR